MDLIDREKEHHANYLETTTKSLLEPGSNCVHCFKHFKTHSVVCTDKVEKVMHEFQITLFTAFISVLIFFLPYLTQYSIYVVLLFT